MPNVKLSAAELTLACNADVLLTKNLVIGKVYELFGHLLDSYRAKTSHDLLPKEVLKTSPKISRGENYLGLPWVMLDYPRHFEGDNFFAVRTMFWWGSHFSQFILLKGAYILPDMADSLYQSPKKAGWSICIDKDPWQHHFEKNNMLPLENMTTQEIAEQIAKWGFLKIGRKAAIESWDTIPNFMNDGYTEGLALVGY